MTDFHSYPLLSSTSWSLTDSPNLRTTSTHWTQLLWISKIISTTTTLHQLHRQSSLLIRHFILLHRRLRMTRPFGIWCQRGRMIWRSDVIFRGSSFHYMHELWTLALACLFMWYFAWTWSVIFMWLWTRTCAWMWWWTMFVILFSYLVACSSSCEDLRLTLMFFNYPWITYMCLLPWSLFCRGNSVKIVISMHMCGNQMKIICTYVGGYFLYFFVLEAFTLSFYLNLLGRVSDSKTQNYQKGGYWRHLGP
jgi:hypothetical protein